MFKDNEDFTSLAAFNRFLSKVSDDNTKTIFKGLFDYQQKKINAAKNAMNKVLETGGTLQNALHAYNEVSTIPRTDMIQLVTDLNIQAGFSNPMIQSNFNEQGKLPRYDEQESITSFIDLTTYAKNVNSSANSTEIQTTQSFDAEHANNVIEQLLVEIQSLKDKIKELEKNKDNTMQQVVYEQKNSDLTHFVKWVLNYSPGLGHFNSEIKDIKSIPVNALNKPNSYEDVNSSLALGRQGQVILSFSEPMSDNLIVYEASTEKNIRELATVEVSIDGKNWIVLKQTQYNNDGSYVHEYGYDLTNIGCIEYVRITDNAPSTWGDGFDVDAVGATKTCTNPA
jgi:hypothetical protein